MMILRIDTQRIVDWSSFHDVFLETMGFPSFYGRNMNAWIDCMSDVDADSGMTSVRVAPGEMLTLHLANADELALRCPEQLAALVDCSAFVNWRRIESGGDAVLALSFKRSA